MFFVKRRHNPLLACTPVQASRGEALSRFETAGAKLAKKTMAKEPFFYLWSTQVSAKHAVKGN
jgi:hypothetical protein